MACFLENVFHIFIVSPVLVLNVTTKTDTIWSFSSHFTILSSSDTSLVPESERYSSSSCGSARSGDAGGTLEVAGGALQPSPSDLQGGVGPPGPLLHPNPEHPAVLRLLEGHDSRSSAGDAIRASSPGFSVDGISSQSNRRARSDRSTILLVGVGLTADWKR